METLGPASELDAVNELLASIGEDPVLDLDDLPPSGNTALSVIHTQSRDVQEEPRWFNFETDVMLSPNVDGFVIVPGNVLDIDSTDGDIIQVGNRLYNRESKTYVFASPVSCEILWHRPWDELPSVARRYITALAIERFIEGFPGAEATTPSRQRNLARASNAFFRAELRAGDFNLLNNASIQTIARRS
ncbi:MULTISPECIES: hypothetical protein [unclassified Mesorhizobium]|uniref:hypothetical protein n=1 Tax=unclassified Mesorhizobium TaxID=325217 RepID=UPI0003CEE5CC|nr:MULTISPECIES: hypothetical protein [unclassified Mesorhizobium]ESX98705.1 hypothetical protein X755_15220 [Mesorhizobium sp. LNJC405B00]ESY42011.1 hypothetical protein X747_14490 [Mesorhizobium sp. LNJC384A00]